MKSPQRPIGTGLLGLGVVGGGVAQALCSHEESLAHRIGRPLVLRRVLVRDLAKPRSVSLPSHLLTDDVEQILGDPDIDVVIELMGGDNPAGSYIRQALQRGKNVVTANKEVMAKEGADLMSLAATKRLSLLFEGAVGGAIPIVGSLMKDLLANRIHSIHAIINGTTNFVLTRMAHKGMDFHSALQLAQELGYAEANPINDIEGIDAAYKLAILATLAFHCRVHVEDVYREGVSRLQARDFRYARELGYAIKLLAIAQRDGDSMEVRVHPALVPESHLLAKVDEAYNAVEVEGDLLGRTVFHGLGAGREPTTSAVLGDLIEVGRRLVANSDMPRALGWEKELRLKPMSELETRYYLRMNVMDRAGVLAQITRVLGDLNISIASIIQKDADLERQTAEIVITTHASKEAAVQKSLIYLKEFEVVREIDNLIRVEEWPTEA